MLASASVLAAAEAPLEYASGGKDDNDRESAQCGSAAQAEAIKLGDPGRLQIGAQRGAKFGVEDTTEGADRRTSVNHNGTARTTEVPSDDFAAAWGWKQWSTGDML